ncbi:uncharacterized protein CEXT_644761, partial [Caerostris extrusa]
TFNQSNFCPVLIARNPLVVAGNPCALLICRRKLKVLSLGANQKKEDTKRKRALCMVKDSMQRMHAGYAKQLDGKLNELTAVLTRVEHLHEEIVEFKQYEDEEGESKMDAFTRVTSKKTENRINHTRDHFELNQKRQNDERLFSEFSESINQQVQWSVQIMERCLQKSDMRRKNRLDAKLTELQSILRELKKICTIKDCV